MWLKHSRPVKEEPGVPVKDELKGRKINMVMVLGLKKG